MKTSLQYDSLGEIQMPGDAYYGAQTLRALVNFKDVSALLVGEPPFIITAMRNLLWLRRVLF